MPKSGRRNIKKESIPILDGESSALPASPTAPLQSFQHDMPVQSQQQLQPPGPTQDRNGPIQNPSLRPQIMPSPQPRGAKIAIPRLRRYSGNATTAVASFSGDKHRVSHACEPCRQRKTKCSGERPTCKHCSDCKINCEYADGKRLRTQKVLGSLIGRLDECDKVLRDILPRVHETDQIAIRKVLEPEMGLDDDEAVSVSSSRRTDTLTIHDGVNGDFDEFEGEKHVSASVGSTESLDHVHEDFNQSAATRATGYVGKSSELTWLHRLNRQVADGSDIDEGEPDSAYMDGHSTTPAHDQLGSSPTPLHKLTYHCDDIPMFNLDHVDPYEMPHQQTANLLFQSYLEMVHPAFPILGKITFQEQFHLFSDNLSMNTGDKWRAILNLIFAISAKYAQLVQAGWRGDERDHMIYFTRARKLGFNSDSLLNHPDLQRLQIASLMAFYLTSVNQISRAWNIIGIAIRQACTLGLNLQNCSNQMTDSFKEIRYRVWWAVCSLERLLAVMTGRSNYFTGATCTVPLPIPIDEEIFFPNGDLTLHASAIRPTRQYSSFDSRSTGSILSTPFPSHSSKLMETRAESLSPTFSLQSTVDSSKTIPPSHAMYFFHYSKMSVLTDDILTQLYRATAGSHSWAQIQTIISKLESQLQGWLSALPTVFDFTKKQRELTFLRQRMSFGFSYYSTMLIITRPCLCRLNQKIPYQSEKAKTFNCSTARKCVNAAKDIVGMLPNEPNSVGLYKVAPWWCIIHHLVQAASILMLELSFGAEHLPHEVDVILSSAKKAVNWLRSMSGSDLAAYRAWEICDSILRKVAPKVGRQIDSLPMDGFKDLRASRDSMPNLNRNPGDSIMMPGTEVDGYPQGHNDTNSGDSVMMPGTEVDGYSQGHNDSNSGDSIMMSGTEVDGYSQGHNDSNSGDSVMMPGTEIDGYSQGHNDRNSRNSVMMPGTEIDGFQQGKNPVPRRGSENLPFHPLAYTYDDNFSPQEATSNPAMTSTTAFPPASQADMMDYLDFSPDISSSDPWNINRGPS